MLDLQVGIDPRHQVVLECTFDHLMEEVAREHSMYICAREIGCKRL